MKITQHTMLNGRVRVDMGRSQRSRLGQTVGLREVSTDVASLLTTCGVARF